MEFEKNTGSYRATSEESALLGANGKENWLPDEVGELIDLAAMAVTRLTHTDLSEIPLSASGMQVRSTYEANVRRIGGVLSCLKRNTALSEDDYKNLADGLSF